jgi:beta-fructofuranosidase
MQSVTAGALLATKPGRSLGVNRREAPVPSSGQSAAPREFFYRPQNAWAGDFIPFYKDGRFHLFHLLTWRDERGHGEGTPWYQISTDDFVHFAEHGPMLERGTPQDQGLYVFTGSVIEGEGRYHIFYTGHNPHLREQGKPQEAVLHAVSDDLLHWQKLPQEKLFAPTAMYEPDDWRDPFVFWNEEAREYWMLLAARITRGPSRRRGCTGLCVSKDLTHWEPREPFWRPGLYSVHECPDLFRLGDWWYLLFSEGSERTATHYRMSRSLNGPWLNPPNDTFDSRIYYAAKTASNGHHRYLFGWESTREHNSDEGRWQWGGNLVVHELAQEADGTLSVHAPASVTQAIGKRVPFEFQPGVGRNEITAEGVNVDALDSFACSPAGAMPGLCRIEATVTFTEGTKGCGLMLRTSPDLDSTYYLRLEPTRNRLVFDSWPRAGDVPYWVETERPAAMRAGVPAKLQVFVEGSLCVVYVNERIAMSTRMYDRATGAWGVFVNQGSAKFTNLRVWEREMA